MENKKRKTFKMFKIKQEKQKNDVINVHTHTT